MPKMTFLTHDNQTYEVNMQEGVSIMQASKPFPFALEGACGGSMGCATCHVMIPEPWLSRLPMPSEQEELVLDVAFNITPISRLGCQVFVDKSMEGMVVNLPEAIDFASAIIAKA